MTEFTIKPRWFYNQTISRALQGRGRNPLMLGLSHEQLDILGINASMLYPNWQHDIFHRKITFEVKQRFEEAHRKHKAERIAQRHAKREARKS